MEVAVETAMPIDAVGTIRCPCTVSSVAMALLMRSATFSTPGPFRTSGTTTTNSSPPNRPTRSDGAQHRGDAVGDERQDLVARRVPEGVVDQLEVVEVDEQHADPRAGRRRGAQVRLEHVEDPRPVAQPGERVVEGLVAQLLARLALGGDVDDLDHERGRRSSVSDHHRRDARPQRPTVRPQQRQAALVLVHVARR